MNIRKKNESCHLSFVSLTLLLILLIKISTVLSSVALRNQFDSVQLIMIEHMFRVRPYLKDQRKVHLCLIVSLGQVVASQCTDFNLSLTFP